MVKIPTQISKLVTLLTTLVLIALTSWSIASAQPAIMTVVGLALTAIFGFISFLDIRNMVRGK